MKKLIKSRSQTTYISVSVNISHVGGKFSLNKKERKAEAGKEEKPQAVLNEDQINEPILLTVAEAGRFLCFPVKTIFELATSGKLQYSNPTGNTMLFRKEKLSEWVSKNKGEITKRLSRMGKKFLLNKILLGGMNDEVAGILSALVESRFPTPVS